MPALLTRMPDAAPVQIALGDGPSDRPGHPPYVRYQRGQIASRRCIDGIAGADFWVEPQFPQRGYDSVLRTTGKAMEQHGMSARRDGQRRPCVFMGRTADHPMLAMPGALQIMDNLARGCFRRMGHESIIYYATKIDSRICTP